MKKLVTLLLIGVSFSVYAQDKVWVFFSDKDATGFDPHTFFDQKAIERRLKHGIDLYDVSDIPVNESYVSAVEGIVGETKVVSRWFNAACCLANEEQKAQLRKLEFVTSVKTVNPGATWCAGMEKSGEETGSFEPSEDQLEFLDAQIKRMNGYVFKKNKVKGQGVRIAIFDVGFKSYKTNPAFEHIRKANRIIKTYNFVKKKEEVDGWDTHGTFVMSCVGGIIKGQEMGLATEAEFLLARTETWTEFYSEEENWLAAAEWADQNGADVINSSLGYTFHRYFREDMDGETSLVSKAANMAARKGIVVVNSAGNEGSDNWKNIGTPADADSVLSIGGISPWTGIHTSFSSFGPTWDKRLKPNVTAYGHVIGSGPKGISQTQGTSFSGPLVAGFVACALQSRPAFSNMKLFHEVEKSGDLYPYFDYAHGYGVPQADYFFTWPSAPKPTFKLKETGTSITVERLDTSNLESSSGEAVHYTQWPDYVFYHVENKKNYLDKYFVINPATSWTDKKGVYDDYITEAPSPLVILKKDYAKPFTLRVFYKGYVEEIEVK
ncbi:MAG: S8 family serine peptidase [Bacteroidia bacterium]|nr:S8 family serine peptidase [Bacteroidia bacterium]